MVIGVGPVLSGSRAERPTANRPRIGEEAAIQRTAVNPTEWGLGVSSNQGVYSDWIGPSGVMPPQSLIGVARLVMPELLVEIEVQAAA